jgi:hypothetical protein
MCKTYPNLSYIVLLLVVVPVCLAQLPDVPDEAVQALGATEGTPQSNGFVFFEGRYIAPPYKVTRKGNGIFVNSIQVEQPFAWMAETLTLAALPPTKKPEEEVKKSDGDSGDTAVEVPGEKTTEDFMSASVLPAEVKPVDKTVGKGLDLLFGDGSAQPATAEKNDSAVEKKAVPVTLTQKQKNELRSKLDAIRLRFEMGLSQGEIFLFNDKNGRINGTYGTAKALFAVLPEAVRYSQSPQDLMSRLNQGGVKFLDINACTDLYRNKFNFIGLSERRRAIELNEEKKYQLRSK